MKKSLATAMCVGTVVTIFATAAFAGPARDPRIHQREINQRNRIDQGIVSGELTPVEARILEAEQAKIRHDELRMKSDGRITPAERARLTMEQNRASRDIYRLKHNRWKVQ